MQINTQYKLRQVAGENIIMLQGANPGDMTRVISLNDTALYLWNSLQGKDFVPEDLTALLLDRYQVEESTARRDAEDFIQTLQQNKLILA